MMVNFAQFELVLAIVLASCTDFQTTFGGLLAIEALINQRKAPTIVSVSYGICEAALGAAGNATFNSAYRQRPRRRVCLYLCLLARKGRRVAMPTMLCR